MFYWDPVGTEEAWSEDSCYAPRMINAVVAVVTFDLQQPCRPSLQNWFSLEKTIWTSPSVPYVVGPICWRCYLLDPSRKDA